MGKREWPWIAIAAVASISCSAIACLAQAELVAQQPLSARGQPVVGFPDGAPAVAPARLELTADEMAALRNGRYRAAIAMQALDTPWNSLQVQAITETLAKYGVDVVAVTDAAQDPQRQAARSAA